MNQLAIYLLAGGPAMRKLQWLLLLLVVLGWFNVGTVWLIQFSGYPIWHYVGHSEFAAFYHVWQQNTWWVVRVPFTIAALATVALLTLPSREIPRRAVWLGVAMQAAIMLVSSLWVWPCESQAALLLGRQDDSAYRQLIVANWALIAPVTAFALLGLSMLRRALWPRAGKARAHALLLATSALAFYGLGNIWLVQFVCYRLWPSVGRNEAYGYHLAWWHSIWGVVFIPAGAVLAGSIAMLWIRPAGITRRTGWRAFSVQALAYLVTAAWFGPLMARLATLEGGLQVSLYHLMMNTHWFRLALFTAYAVMCGWMLARSAGRPAWSDA
jgi:hypothetical protein